MEKKNKFAEFLKRPNGIFLIVLCLVLIGSVAVSVFFVAVS